MAGAAIADSVLKVSGKKAHLHFMEPGLVLGRGKPKSFSPIRVDKNSPVAGLINWLSETGAHTFGARGAWPGSAKRVHLTK